MLGDVTANADDRLRPAPGRLHVRRDRRRRGRADVQLGLHGDGTARRDDEEPVAHLPAAGTYDAKVTVSDGEDVGVQDRARCSVLPADDAGGAVPGARVLQDRRASGTSRSTRASRRSGSSARRTTSRSTPRRTRRRSAPGVLAQYDTVVFLSTTGDLLNDAQQAAFEGYIQARRRLHRHPRRGRHRVRRGRGTAGWWARTSATTRPGTRTRRSLIEDARSPLARPGIASPWPRDGRVVQLPVAGEPEVGRRRHGLQPAAGRPRARRTSTRRPTTRTTATRRMTTIRSRGASATTAAARGTRAWATRRRRSARPHFRKHLLGGLEVSAGAVDRRGVRRHGPSRATSSCRRSRIRPPGRRR